MQEMQEMQEMHAGDCRSQCWSFDACVSVDDWMTDERHNAECCSRCTCLPVVCSEIQRKLPVLDQSSSCVDMWISKCVKEPNYFRCLSCMRLLGAEILWACHNIYISEALKYAPGALKGSACEDF